MKKLVVGEIKKISNMLKREVMNFVKFKKNISLTGSHGHILGYLYNNINENIFQKDIEKKFDIRRSTATKTLNLMEKNGLITRECVEIDARLKKIVLTDKAVELHNEIIEEINEFEKVLLKGVTQEEIDNFFVVLDKIKDNLKVEA